LKHISLCNVARKYICDASALTAPQSLQDCRIKLAAVSGRNFSLVPGIEG
jgi:hypothetical protein